jgi:hypothetical protein
VELGFHVIDQLLIIFWHLSDTGGKWVLNETLCQLVIDFRKTCDLVGRNVLYTVPIEFGISMKLIVTLSKTCLNETYRKVHMGKHLSNQSLDQ